MSQSDLPHWQLSSIFPGLESSAYETAKLELQTKLNALETLMNEQGLGSGRQASLSPATIPLLESLLTDLNKLSDELIDLLSYVTGFTATNAFDSAAQAEASNLKPLRGQLSILKTRFTAWLGTFNTNEFIEDSAQAHAHFLRKARVIAQHLMTDDAEALAARLDESGASAWSKLHTDLVSRTTIQRDLPGRETAEYSLAELKNLQSSADSALRRAAFEAELELLSQNEVAFAAAMNSIKGQVNILCESRGWPSALAQSLVQNNISAKSLNALQTACLETFPDFRRYLRAKAKAFGKDTLAWYDLAAPLASGQERHFSWDEAKAYVITHFRSYSDDLAAFAEHVFSEGWCDVPPRKGKRNGAFCMGIPGRKESRILLNFGHTLDDVFTLAHELGHAHHNEQLYRAGRTALQSDTPMLLAETASIFCETIVLNAALAEANDAERLAILAQDLLSTTGLVVDIYSRFIFEESVFERRKLRELSVAELNEIMLNAQAATYGSALSEAERHPLMWAHKGHYYNSARSYYNYPYTFGYLFGLGLYNVYQNEPEGFHERYDTLLSSTGMADAATLARGFGINIESADFWRGSLDLIGERSRQFEALID